MTVVQQGALNTSALSVPDLYVQIVPPTENYVNGIPTNVLGIVGTAQWGPVGVPAIIGSLGAAVQAFGGVQARKYDLLTAAWAAVLNGANNMRLVRVTDGTDVAASATVGTTGLTLAARYTGSLGNAVAWQLRAGSRAGTWAVVLAMPGVVPEVFDNIGAGLTGNALWAAIASAINVGASALRGPSQIVVATAGASTSAPIAANGTLTGGTDGAGTITGATLLGADTAPRRGMYALRGSGAAVALLADCDDPTTWNAQVAYGLSEGTYMVATGPSGDTIANATAAIAGAGVDSYALKVMFGDWCLFNDTVNGVQRFVSPQGFEAGELSALSPEQSSLNKPLYGILGTQRTMSGAGYSSAEMQALAQAGIDVITNPIPAGASFGARLGVNASSNPAVNGDNYTRLTNYIASTLNRAMGIYIGKLQTPTVRAQALGAVSSFLANMQQQSMIGDVSRPGADAFSVRLDATNNPPARVALGYMQLDLRVTYLSVITRLLVNVEGGQTVRVTVISQTSAR